MNGTPGINCIGIIMDGNRRWARAKGLSVPEGHAEGYKRLKEVLRLVRDAGIKHAAVYAFSTENWQRAEDEVGYLMKLFRSILENETKELIADRVRVVFIGDRARFTPDMQSMMAAMEKATSENYEVTLHLLMSYGGRAEIVAATNALLVSGETNITEDSFAEKLWSHPMPDPDLIIRTGGEKRLSNFLPWQTVYSELFFSDSFWPDFSKEEFDSILAEFSARERRHGK
jgi:undecaprenyl diphosphate synthase